MMTRNRLDAELRRLDILEAAAQVAIEHGYRQITQAQIAEKADISAGLITYHFSSMAKLRKKLMVWAVQEKNLTIIAQGLAMHDPIALAAPRTTRANAAALLAAVSPAPVPLRDA